ncbi:MAG: thioesterase [Paenibacillaceae bacterium]|jgi:acyl-CoA thioester hydrolase|nr:thioesterase [Paenibacillaceae bacterium]
MGVVYHGNYMDWFEIGRTELIRSHGLPYSDIEARGLLLPLIDLQAKFAKPARYDDVVAIYTRLAEFTHVQVSFESEIRRVEASCLGSSSSASVGVVEPDGELLVSGATRHVWVDRSFKPVRLDKLAPDVYAVLTEAAGVS